MPESDYQNSQTWQHTLGIEDAVHREAVERLKTSYINARGKATVLAALINERLPFFTKHDMGHIDALWFAADTLLWDEENKKLYELNPAEAYVLGLSFLLHDLGMALVAYEEGLDGLRKEKYFRDSVASEFRKEYKRTIEPQDWKELDSDYGSLNGKCKVIVDRAIAATLRDQHAAKAEKLAFYSVKDKDEKGELYLIDDSGLRDAYGRLAGRLAASHGWGYDALREAFNDAYIGAPSIMPNEWKIDARKLALIFRLADAMNIDDSRAPLLEFKLLAAEGNANEHWVFQQKLYKPTVKDERLYFTSKSEFGISEIEAWWLCHDTLRTIDEELRNADTLLLEKGKAPFRARGVYGISSANDLSAYIEVEGWKPLDTTIRVGDVGRLVRTLGGEQLYGENTEWVPFRELIQNGTDAVRARRLFKKDPMYNGEVRISFEESDGAQYILFSDNGIGMSEAVLTGPFLDFGQSFWGTSLMNRELPGLAASGFKSTGRFGIGFYSVFMWSDEVKVITKRFGDSQRTLVLDFKNSVESRPVLRSAEDNEVMVGSGTVIRIKLTEELADKLRSGAVFAKLFGKQLEASIANLCPSIDCDLYVAGKRVVAANDWIDLSPHKLISRVIPSNVHFSLSSSLIIDNIKYIDSIVCDDRMIGRAAVSFARTSNTGCIVSAGFYTQFSDEFLGIIDGSVLSVSRNSVDIERKSGKFSDWALAQANNTYIQSFDAQNQARIAGVISSFGVTPHKLYIAESTAGLLTFDDIVGLSENCTNERMILLSHDPSHISEGRWMRDSIPKIDRNVLWCVSQNDSYRLLPLIVNAICLGFSSIQSCTNAIVEYSCAHTVIGLKKADELSAWTPWKKEPFAIIYRKATSPKEDTDQ